MRDLAKVELNDVFNPYSNVCPVFDRSERSPLLRQAMLCQHLEAVANAGSGIMWMGRDLGYRGGRRTGIALTDEAHLQDFFNLYGVSRSDRVTVGPVVAERTANEIWRVLSSIDRLPALWNVFPFHPHEPGRPFSNRKFTAVELDAARDLNARLLRLVSADRIVAIGNDAAHYSRGLGVEVVTVRHPSYGGIADFRLGMAALYGERLEVRQGQLDI